MKDPRQEAPVWVQLVIQTLIFYSVATMILETLPALEPYHAYFAVSDTIIAIVFTVEYLAFWAISDNKRKYPFTIDSMIDLMAIVPFFLQFGTPFLALRAIRFLRIFRILKLSKYNRAVDTLSLAVKRCAAELWITVYIAVIVILLSSTALYVAENEAQPEAYESIPAAMWSAIATLTTVGYGDVFPVTSLGRFIAVSIMLAGIGFVAIPTGLISSQLTAILQEKRLSAQGRAARLVHFRE